MKNGLVKGVNMYKQLKLVLILIFFLNCADFLTTLYCVNTWGIGGEGNPIVRENFLQASVTKLTIIPILLCAMYFSITNPQLCGHYITMWFSYQIIALMLAMYIYVVTNNFLVIFGII